ncbi:hypothetical protein X764_16650, partial [Mesorhizobium sp. LSHC440A00]
MAARAVIRFAAILVAATTIVAVPASAQTNDPNAGRADCTDAAGAAAADCPKDGNEANVGGEPGAVTLPALIVDLFPNPPAPEAPVPTPRPSAPPADTQAGPPAGGAIVSPTDLVATA